MTTDTVAAGQGTLTLETSLLGPLSLPDGAARAMELADLMLCAVVYATRDCGDGTQRVYRSAWQSSNVGWCAGLGHAPLAGDPDILAMYVVHRADQGCTASTIRVDLAAILAAHRLASIALDLRHPRRAMVVEGITRGRGVWPRRQATPPVLELLRRLLAARLVASTPLGARDQAMLLLGFGAALRHSDLVGLIWVMS